MQEIIINFVTNRNDGSYAVHPLHVDGKTALSHWQSFESWKALLKTMRYLGATEEQIACFEDAKRRSGAGNVHIRLLPDRKNLLGIDYSKLVRTSEQPQKTMQGDILAKPPFVVSYLESLVDGFLHTRPTRAAAKEISGRIRKRTRFHFGNSDILPSHSTDRCDSIEDAS
jgi:hypothetical protein